MLAVGLVFIPCSHNVKGLKAVPIKPYLCSELHFYPKMGIPLLLILAYLTYNNALRARAFGLNSLRWSVATLMLFLLGIFLGSMVLGIILMSKNPQLYQLSLQGKQLEVNNFLMDAFKQNNFLYSTLIFSGGFGGYLLVRFLIERKARRNMGQ